MTYLLLFVGGGLGTLMRFGVNRMAFGLVGASLPLGTFFVNVAGSFVMGALAAWFARHPGMMAEWRLFLMTGVLGGFTTFSAFSLDALELWQAHSPAMALLYVAGSVVLSLVALCAGFFLLRALL